MTNKIFKVMGLSAVLAAAFTVSAFADEKITTVDFVCGISSDTEIEAGITSPQFEITEDSVGYELAGYEEVNPDATTYKSPRTYELTFTSESGYYFPDESEITVNGKGISSITKKNTDNEDSFVVRCKAYPYYCWDVPTIKSDDDVLSNVDLSSGQKKISWEKNGASSFDYLLTYVTQSGETKNLSGSTSSSSLSISSYVKKNTRTGDNASDYQDSYVEGFAIRAKGNAGDNTRTAPSDWAILGSITTDDFEVTTYETWGDIVSDTLTGITGGGGSSSSYGPGSSEANSSSSKNGWDGSGTSWTYYSNGSLVKGWINDSGSWYYSDPSSGVMQAGWILADGKWYYMNADQSNGIPYGKMLTGWITYNGAQYYLNPNEGGPMGSMVTGQVNINGTAYTFNDSGALVG